MYSSSGKKMKWIQMFKYLLVTNIQAVCNVFTTCDCGPTTSASNQEAFVSPPVTKRWTALLEPSICPALCTPVMAANFWAS